MGVTFLQRVADSNGVLAQAFRALKFGAGLTVTPRPGQTLSGGGNGADVTDYLEIAATAAQVVTQAVRGVITSNVNTASFTVAQTGITYAQGDSILLVNQSTGSQNGAYTVGAISGGHAPLTRATWADASAELIPGMVIRVSPDDPTYPGTTWSLVTPAPITIGSTSLRFVRIGKTVDPTLFGALGIGGDDRAALQAAINAAEAVGGTVEVPPGTFGVGLGTGGDAANGLILSSSIRLRLDSGAKIVGLGAGNLYVFTFDTSNVTIECADRFTSSIQCSSGARTFLWRNSWTAGGTGKAHLRFQRCGFLGNGAASYLVDNTTAPGGITLPTINEASITFDDCLISQFGTTAIKTGTSVYYWRFNNCYFFQNVGVDSTDVAGSLLIGASCDGMVFQSIFVQGYGPQIICESQRIVFDSLQMYGAAQNAVYGADIMFRPPTTLDSGKGKVINCHFGGENEGMNPNRSRVRFRNSANPSYGILAVALIGCDFTDKGQLAVHLTRSGTTITASFDVGFHGCAPFDTFLMYVTSASDPTFNGTFTWTATDASHATCTNAAAVGSATTALAVPGKSHAAIRIDNPVRGLVVDYCNFEGYATHIFDNQSAAVGFASASLVSTFRGQCIYGGNNRAIPPVYGTFEVFRNGGRDFFNCGIPNVGRDRMVLDVLGEAVELRNRVSWSEDLSQASWVKDTGVMITTGQTDPFGGTTACTITRDGSAGNQKASITLDTTGMGTRVLVDVWLEAGTLDSCVIGIFDASANTETTLLETGAYVSDMPGFQLDSTWRHFRFWVNGVTAGHTLKLRFLPGGVDTLAGSIKAAFVMVNDKGGDYYKTTGSAGSTTSYGKHYQNGVQFDGLVAFNGHIASDATPDTDNSRSLGSQTLRWLAAHAATIIARADTTNTSWSKLTATALNAAATDFAMQIAGTAVAKFSSSWGLELLQGLKANVAAGVPSSIAAGGGFGSGATAALLSGSTDLWGTIEITTGTGATNSGTITVTLSRALPKDFTVFVTLEDNPSASPAWDSNTFAPSAKIQLRSRTGGSGGKSTFTIFCGNTNLNFTSSTTGLRVGYLVVMNDA